MKNVTDAFKAAQASPSSVSLRRVSYKRRYWQQSTQSFIWETNWTALSEADVVSVSAITAKLDTEAVNEFKISNLTITLKNADRRWTPTNKFGRFGKDAASPLYGYEPFWTKFRIETGYVVNGVDTFVPLFVGVAVDFQTAGHSDTMQVSVQGLEALLQNANAEEAGIFVENETPTGTINGTNKDFVTIQPGVGLIYNVTVDGVEKKAGTQYSISDLDTPTLGAKITFETAPTVGQVVKVWYRYWKQNQKIESLVYDLLTSAGISGSSLDISTVTFPTGITQSHIVNEFNEWILGTNTKTTTNDTPGDLSLNYADETNKTLIDDFSSVPSLDPAWTKNGAYDHVTGPWILLGSTTSQGSIYRASTKTIGAWQIKLTYSAGGDTSGLSYIEFYFMGGDPDTRVYGNYYLKNSYKVTVKRKSGDLDNGEVFLQKVNSSGTVTNISYVTQRVDSSAFTLGVGRNPGGFFYVYFNGTLILTGQDLSYSTSTNILVNAYQSELNYSSRWAVDDVYSPSTSASGNYVSKSFDCLSTPSNWGNFYSEISTSASGAVSFSSSTSADGITWDSYVPISNNNIGSSLKRYIKIKADLSGGTTDSDTCSVNIFKVFYTNQATILKMAPMTGQTTYQAIKNMAALSNYEWGFSENERFFFRPKIVTQTPSTLFDSGKNLIDITNIQNGESRVYTEVLAEFGNYSIVKKTSAGTPHSTLSSIGVKRYSISAGNVLLNEDTDIASNAAEGLLVYFEKKRRTAKAKTKLMEWVDLSDTVLVNFRDKPNNWWMGDTHVYLGQTDIHLHGPEANTLDGFLAKVVGYRHDTESKTSEFDLEEIIQ